MFFQTPFKCYKHLLRPVTKVKVKKIYLSFEATSFLVHLFLTEKDRWFTPLKDLKTTDLDFIGTTATILTWLTQTLVDVRVAVCAGEPCVCAVTLIPVGERQEKK